MRRFDYLIVGGGMASSAAVVGIRELDRGRSIGILCAETELPYARPPLSKGLWKGMTLESIRMDTADAELILGRTADSLDPGAHTLTCAGGGSYGYGKLLLATGGSPRRLPGDDSRIIYLRSLADYRALRARCATARSFLVVGGGFLASEIAAALVAEGKEVAMAFPEAGMGARIFPRDLSQWVTELFRSKGVEIFAGERIASVQGRGEAEVARAHSGREWEADAVVAGLGILPNAALAGAAGLVVDDGIAVGNDLRSSDPDIYAAGDAASFRCEALGTRIRSEHEDNALAMGLAAGRNMAGASETYGRIPCFYSEFFGQAYDAVGELDASLETSADWRRPCEEGTVHYLREGRVRGVLLWNVRRKVEAARALVGSNVPFSRYLSAPGP